MRSIQRFLIDESGPTAVEYAVMLALIIVVMVAAVMTVGTTSSGTFQSAADALE